jgi:hypothetical protein
MNRKLTLAIALVTFLGMTGSAFAQSSKAAWRFENLVALGAAALTTDPTLDGDTDWQPILVTHIKTPNAKELAIGVSLQCGIVTDTTVRSKGGELDTSAAQGRIKVRIRLTLPDGTTTTYAQPDSGADLTDTLLPADVGITYCDRYQKLEAKFAGLNCVAEQGDTDGDGVAGEVTCADPEELRLILKTLNAHHFNFLYANATPGVHKVEVLARAQAAVTLGGSMLGSAGAEAFAGAGSLSVETIRLIKDANGTTDLDNLR